METDNSRLGRNPFIMSSGSSYLNFKKRNGTAVPLDESKIYTTLVRACEGYTPDVSPDLLYKHLQSSLYTGITAQELETTLILTATSFIERDPAYSIVATRLLLQKLYKEVAEKSLVPAIFPALYRESFVTYIKEGIEANIFDARMGDYDLELLAKKLVPERDALFDYMGMCTLYERYLVKINGRRRELPQAFFMRIAMGIALLEEDKTARALEFYELLSNMYYIPSTPTLFHAGFPIAQLSSCYLNTVNDDLAHIFKVIGDNAQLAKWAGGIGTSWTNIRGTGAYIKTIKATTQGVVPFLKVANDVVSAITKTGIRRGGTCVYLETWHLDIEEFLDLRRNTGDERRRTHDMNTANWIPDLFMKRVLEDKIWTLFSPNETSDLPELYGAAFEARYNYYEEQARLGKLKHYKELPAKQLWRKMLTRLFETGHPWITWKDPSNIRSPQDHAGVIHNSNLCTEITLNTSTQETAVCNLGSVNLERHFVGSTLNHEQLAYTIKTAVRMLDNIIDLNFYPTVEAKNSNIRHRPIGLGVMGFQDALFKLCIPFESQEALDFADQMGELFSYYALSASCELAKERGCYESYQGSKWSRGIFPLDTLDILEAERGTPIEVSRSSTLDWKPLREEIKKYGMRNSNVMAIAPTATISTIAGCYPSIEPIYKNIYVKSNISGEFTIVNKYLVKDLKERNLWSKTMLDQLKYYDGDLANISLIPAELKRLYKTSFELDPLWLIRITAARGKWIDQSQSHNIFMRGVSGNKLHEVYTTAWKCGLKTTYYLRTLGASQIEKATLDASQFGYTQKREYIPAAQTCSIENSDCESCQ